MAGTSRVMLAFVVALIAATPAFAQDDLFKAEVHKSVEGRIARPQAPLHAQVDQSAPGTLPPLMGQAQRDGLSSLDFELPQSAQAVSSDACYRMNARRNAYNAGVMAYGHPNYRRAGGISTSEYGQPRLDACARQFGPLFRDPSLAQLGIDGYLGMRSRPVIQRTVNYGAIERHYASLIPHVDVCRCHYW